MRLSSLDLNLLVALDRLLDTGSVSKAAKELGLSQPAMSRTLQRLRDVLGDPLLVKDGRTLTPTERARELVPAVERALDAARAVFEAPPSFDPAAARGEVRLALGDDTQGLFAAAIVAAFAREAPHLDLRFHPLSAETVREGRRGRVDLALTPDLSVLPPTAGRVDLDDFVTRPVYVRRFVTMWSADRPGPAPTTLEAYAEARHVVVSVDGSGRGFVDDVLDELGVRRRIAATVTGMITAARLVAASDLVGTLPGELASIPGLRSADPPFALPPVPMMLVWHPRFSSDPRHRFVRDLVGRTVTATGAR
jgi:DNA-binding transcriptional LysR family regulator